MQAWKCCKVRFFPRKTEELAVTVRNTKVFLSKIPRLSHETEDVFACNAPPTKSYYFRKTNTTFFTFLRKGKPYKYKFSGGDKYLSLKLNRGVTGDIACPSIDCEPIGYYFFVRLASDLFWALENAHSFCADLYSIFFFDVGHKLFLLFLPPWLSKMAIKTKEEPKQASIDFELSI